MSQTALAMKFEIVRRFVEAAHEQNARSTGPFERLVCAQRRNMSSERSLQTRSSFVRVHASSGLSSARSRELTAIELRP